MIEVLFTCEQCGLLAVPVLVPARTSPKEDVKHYVEQVIGGAISATHRKLSPNCTARRMTNVKIPIANEEGAWIGKQPSKEA